MEVVFENETFYGKEMPPASFMKITAHNFLKDLRVRHPAVLPYFEVDLTTRKYQFWQRDPFPIELFTPEVIYQKLDYTHNSPVRGKWMLVEDPVSYKYSSASF